MDFALFSHVPWPEGSEPKQIYDDITEEFLLGEELGFKSAWIAEHHFSRHGLISGIFSLLGNVAARTKNARIGTDIVVLPFVTPYKSQKKPQPSTSSPVED